MTPLKTAVWYFPRSVFATLGAFWLVIDPIIELTGKNVNLSYWELFGWSAFFGAVWVIIDGLWITGFLKPSIEIKSTGFDTRILIKFGDLFEEDGWRAIAVNDFFDSVVDDYLVSSKSLHGVFLQKYWAGNIDDWNRQVDRELIGSRFLTEGRSEGKRNRFELGTTVAVRKDGNKFLCVALSHTDASNQEAKASSLDLNQAVRGLLRKARSVCGDEPLSIPLMGSGLSRVGIKNNILVDLILTAIFEETKVNKVTSEIRIVLPKEKASEINLVSLKKDWS